MTATRKNPYRQRFNAAIAVLATATAAAASLAGSALATQTQSAPCGFVVKAAPWSFKGQKGTAYTVVAEGGARCSTVRTWVPRLTHEHAAFDLAPVPSGWHCSTTGGITTGLTMTGQCTTPMGGIVEWLPKLK